MAKSKLKNKSGKTVAYIVLITAAIICIIPFLMILSASFSNEGEILKRGYSILPRSFTLDAYKTIFEYPDQLINSYMVTIFTTVAGTLLNVTITALTAYPLSRQDYKWKNRISFYFYFTMLFSGGAVPSYILITRYLHLKNNIIVLFLPIMMSVWNVFLLRTYFSGIPRAIVESAKIDGASELRIFSTIIVPLSVTGIATITLIVSLGYWNEWYQSLMYMSDEKNISLQYYLQRIMSNIDAITKNQGGGTLLSGQAAAMPSETARMAICVLAVGPMMFVFMAFQKYFVKGINVGAVKG